MDLGGPKPPVKHKTKTIEISSKYCSDYNAVFWLYRRGTPILLTLVVFFIVPRCFLFNLMKIACYHDETVLENVFTSYCWTRGTFIVPRLVDPNIQSRVPHPGIGTVEDHDNVLYNTIYVWVLPYLMFLYISFRGTWWIWKKHSHGKLILTLMKELDVIVYDDIEGIRARIRRVLKYFERNLNGHRMVVIKYIVLEILNFLHLLFHIWFIDYLLYGNFMSYGPKVLQYLQDTDEVVEDVMAKVFPKIATCQILTIGPSGNQMTVEGLCVLPLNTIMDKFFFVLWFWYLVLFVASCCGFIYRIATICSVRLRTWILRSCCKSCREGSIETICKNVSYGDWFVFLSLKLNMESVILDEILEELAVKLDNQ